MKNIIFNQLTFQVASSIAARSSPRSKQLVLKESFKRTVFVAQLVDWSLLNPEVWNFNPLFYKNVLWTFTVHCIDNTKIKKKQAGNGTLQNQIGINLYMSLSVNRFFYKNYKILDLNCEITSGVVSAIIISLL